MSVDVRVPTTGNAGEDAVIVEWNVAVGDDVTTGDVLVVLETAKSTIDVEAPATGRVLDIRYHAGDEVPEHDVLATLGEPGESIEHTTPSAPTAAPATPERATGRPRISPRARLLAAERGIDTDTLTGTGPLGRIVIADIPASAPSDVQPSHSDSSRTENASETENAAEYTIVPVRGARKVTAQRMHESLSTSAQVTLTRYADADHLLTFVRRLRQVTEAQGTAKIGVNDVLMFAVARVVAKHPEANSWFDWDGIKQFHHVNLGFAVDTDQALLVPVIPHAETLSLSALADATRASIDKARSGTLTTAEMEGGTFTVSNLGGLGVHWFTPVLNPPQSCILGVGAAHHNAPDGPALLPLSLTFDHRALDGAAAATLLADIADAIAAIDVLAAL